VLKNKIKTQGLQALKAREHLFLKKLEKNILCFYFEGSRLNGFMLEY